VTAEIIRKWPELFFGELANLATKIITLLEFFNFVSDVSRLLYE
jgi:hypothetical protein